MLISIVLCTVQSSALLLLFDSTYDIWVEDVQKMAVVPTKRTNNNNRALDRIEAIQLGFCVFNRVRSNKRTDGRKHQMK